LHAQVAGKLHLAPVRLSQPVFKFVHDRDY
jgi:hypothetical protein